MELCGVSHCSDPTFKILVRQPIPSKTARQYFRSVFCRTVWLTLQRLSNVQLFVGWSLLRSNLARLSSFCHFPTFKDFFLLKNIKPSFTPHALHLNPTNARLHISPSRSQ